MRRLFAIPLFLSLALAAEANDTGEISLRSKALASASALSAPAFAAPAYFAPVLSAPRHADASLPSGHDPLPQLLLLDEQEATGGKTVCGNTAKDFCYDLTQRRVVYRGAREYMPSLAGMSPEGVALRHNRIVFSYSFK